MDSNNATDMIDSGDIASSQIIGYSELMRDSYFLGEYPLDTIIEGIRDQFSDYINMEDDTDYVDIFYTQIHMSFKAVESAEDEGRPREIIDALNNILDVFIDEMTRLFSLRLTISISMVEEGDIDQDQLELILRRLYEYFILGAKKNFINVIMKDVLHRIKDVTDEALFGTIEDLMDIYSPLITSINPTQFLQYSDGKDIIEMLDDGIIAGNFLRKYTPKLYQNEEFNLDLIDRIAVAHQFKQEVMSNG